MLLQFGPYACFFAFETSLLGTIWVFYLYLYLFWGLLTSYFHHSLLQLCVGLTDLVVKKKIDKREQELININYSKIPSHYLLLLSSLFWWCSIVIPQILHLVKLLIWHISILGVKFGIMSKLFIAFNVCFPPNNPYTLVEK